MARLLSNQQAIPEALPGDHMSRKGHGTDGANFVPADMAQPTKVFPADSDATIKDAARAWGTTTDPFFTTVGLERNVAFDKRDTPTIGNFIDNYTGGAGLATPSVGAEGGLVPFDMDSRVAYSLANTGMMSAFPSTGMSDLISSTAIKSAISFVEESDQADNDAKDAAILMMERIETDRIPCPRLCGASFSPGIGGLSGTYCLGSVVFATSNAPHRESSLTLASF